MKTTNHKNLEQAIINKNHKDVNDIICSERLIIYSIVYKDDKSVSVEFAQSLRKAKQLARNLCNKTKNKVVVNFHNPFESWREFINVYYDKGYNHKRLQWYYLHVDALQAKNY